MTPTTHRSVKRSLEIFRRASELMPGATQLISRRPSRFAYGVSPIYAASAKGSHVTDVDGNEYIDWVSGVGAIVLGHADEVVDAAVKKQIDRGAISSLNSELEVELADELIQTIPSAEMARYAKGGGEACAMAVRIARGATGRDKVLFCGYHGWHDWYIAANLADDGTLDSHLFPGIEPIGVPKALAGTILPFRYGDLDMLEGLLQGHKGEVACIIMEPLRSQLPEEGYLEGVRELAARHDVVLIFDEVSSGFRPALGGAQEYLGVTPDMTALAKAISNGYPMAAVVGKRSVMEPAAHMFISSSYWSDTVGIIAAMTTIRELRRRNAIAQIHRTGRLIKERISAAIAETGLDAACTGLDFHPAIQFNVEDPLLQKKVVTLYIQEMAKRGIIVLGGFYLNYSHGEEDVSKTVAAATETFAIIKRGLAGGRIDDLLECEPREDIFRRLVS